MIYFFQVSLSIVRSKLVKMDEQELKSEHFCGRLLRTSLKQHSHILLKSSYSSSKCLGGFNAPPLLIVLDLMCVFVLALPPPNPRQSLLSLSDLFHPHHQAWLTEIHEYAQEDVVLMLLGNKARHCGKCFSRLVDRRGR